MDSHVFAWIRMDSRGFAWICMDLAWIWHGFGRSRPARGAFAPILDSFGCVWERFGVVWARLRAFGGQSEPKLLAMTPRAAKLWMLNVCF